YGVSRPTYYQTKATFDKGGIAGLVPQKRGPRGPHKLRGQALAFVQQQLVAGEPVRARELARLVRQKFDLNIHPRTIERAVAGKKNSSMSSANNNSRSHPWSLRSTKPCAVRLSVTRCRPKLVPGCFSFSTVACGDARGR